MQCPNRAEPDEYLVYVIEEMPGGGRLWLFWSETVQDWVSDSARATRYPMAEADGALRARDAERYNPTAGTIWVGHVV